jgi:hypothetical protein
MPYVASPHRRYPQTRAALVRRLRPGAIRTSPLFFGILAYLLGETWVEPAINGLVVTSDGFLLAQLGDDCGHNVMIGRAADLRRNVNGILDCIKASPAQRRYLTSLVADVVGGPGVDGPELPPSG